MDKEKVYMKTNPALAFMSDAEPAEPEPVHYERLNREYKSKRVQILIKPSMYADIERIAAAKEISRNALINEALTMYIAKEKEQY